MELKKLVGISPEVYEHSFDKAALNKLRSLPGFDKVVNFMLNWSYVKWHLVDLQGSNFHVTRESCSELYKLVKDVGKTLDVEELPEIYTEWGYAVNGYTTGTKENALMVLYSGAVDLLSEPQLRFVVGHEMGHVKSGHVLYHMMAEVFSNMIGFIPLGESLLSPIHYALLYWNRMSEFTADRAGLLACQDKDEAIKAIIKMAGMPIKYFDKIDNAAFLKQAEEFEKMSSGIADATIRTISIASSTHPWTVFRAGQLLKWIESGEYDKVLADYAGVPCCHCQNIVARNAKICNVCGLPPFD